MSREARSETPFVDFAAGSTILREGETAAALFIIEAGKVSIERSDAPGVVLNELGPGDFFGETALLQEQPHGANVIARTAVRALRIDAAAFHAVLRENIEVAVQMMRRLVLRLRAAEQRVSESSAARGDAAKAPAADVKAAAAVPAPAAKPANKPVAAPAPAAAAPAAAPAVAAAAPVAPAAEAPAKPAAKSYALRHAEGIIPLPEGKAECLVGRPDPATGAIPEINLGALDLARSLSRRHARLFVAPGGVSLREEPGVANGTWVNGERLAAGQTVTLKPGDKLRFGAIELEFGAT
jgi:hypothetical protein